MAWPPATIAADKGPGAPTSSTEHPDHHNALAAGINDITTEFTTGPLGTKLAGIEAGADVTDAANVAAAGAVMEADTSTALMQFVVDEDTMTSDSATKVPSQQSVKAYVDSVRLQRPPGQYQFAQGWTQGTTSQTDKYLRTREFLIHSATRIIGLRVAVTAAGGAGCKMRIGIYEDNGGFPGNRLLDGGNVDVDSTGEKVAVVDITLQPGVYWITTRVATDAASGTPVMRTITSGSALIASGGMGGAASAAYSFDDTASGQGPLPNPHPVTTAVVNTPARVEFQVGAP